MLKRFLKDTSGQFAIMFSVGATALVIGAGVAIDISGAHKHKASLQSMTDAAVLAAAAQKSDKVAELKQIAQQVVDKMSSTVTHLSIKSLS